MGKKNRKIYGHYEKKSEKFMIEIEGKKMGGVSRWGKERKIYRRWVKKDKYLVEDKEKEENL